VDEAIAEFLSSLGKRGFEMQTSNADCPNSNDQKGTKPPALCNNYGAPRTYGPLA
jgi:hypothetical protein